jgi:hypothetical protein
MVKHGKTMCIIVCDVIFQMCVHGQIDPSLVVIPIGLWSMLCGQSTKIATMLVCDRCLKGWHMACLTLPLD